MRHLWISVALFTTIVVFALAGAAPSYAATPAHPGESPALQPNCIQLVNNGAFESPNLAGWSTQGYAWPDSQVKFSGNFSARIGLSTTLPNQNVSSTLRQTINLPAGHTITLSFQWFPQFDLNIGDADIQFVNIQTADGALVPVVLSTKQNLTSWQFVDFSLNSFAGQQITLIFSVNNDGVGSRTWMNVDDVSVVACPITPTATSTPTVTLTPTPTFTATPLPSGCVTDGILNGGFEEDSFWIFGNAPVRPAFVGSPVRTGLRAVRLGIDPAAVPVSPSQESFSSIRQPFQISPLASTASLSWWHLDRTEEGPLENAPRGVLIDRQEVILLNLDNSTEAILYSKRLNNASWQQTSVDLTAFRGKALVLYFNVLNDGNNLRTWQYIDDVVLTICYAPTATATPTSPPTPTPPPTDTPTPTITPTDTPSSAMSGSAVEPSGANGDLESGEPTILPVEGAGPQAAMFETAPTRSEPSWLDRSIREGLTPIAIMTGILAIIALGVGIAIYRQRSDTSS
ncbi:MAG: hypothetical protein NZ553_14200 [Caldilinea sp.]|nr:hypothetical protein [Caldilinea sp.]MDW8441624.1 hypothetical protein [Caldilineaceae bacterium]